MGQEQIQATLLQWMGDDDTVANAARVSFKKQEVGHSREDNTRLIKYLAKHQHMSPFGHCFASFHIKAPIFVARQLVKHEYLRMNEVSRRYVDTDLEFYAPKVWRGRAKDKKQGSDGVVSPTSLWGFEEENVYDDLYKHYADSIDLYNHLLTQEVAPEMARMVLPQSLMTEWWWSGSLDAFSEMCNLRLKEDTQYETRLVAQQIDKCMLEKFPVSWKELVKREPDGLTST